MKDAVHVPVLVLTGGPCAGKTTALCYVEEKLRNLGFAVFLVREAATELMTSGITPSDGQFGNEEFQRLMVRRMLATEDFYRVAAALSRAPKKVVLCDRGIPDVSPYTEKVFLEKVLASHELSPITARDGRYDAVFHLRSAAIGAEAFYGNETNAVRRETLEEAREKDAATIAAWIGHPHLRVIDNSTDFSGKLKRLFRHICRALAIPAPMEIERKFRVAEPFDPQSIPVPFQKMEIEQAYLHALPGEELRIRKRGQNGVYTYYHTSKKRVPEKGAFRSVETERRISEQVYVELLLVRNSALCIIKKERFCFVWENQYFELDAFVSPPLLFHILEVELREGNDTVVLPDFIPVIGEETSLTNRAIASGSAVPL